MAWFHQLLRKTIKFPTKWLVKTSTIPNDLEMELGIDRNKPILYLLRTNSVTDQIALDNSVSKLGLPSPFDYLPVQEQKLPNCLFLEQPETFFTKKTKHTDIHTRFTELFQLHRADENLDLQIVPVSVFWGRAPGKETQGWSSLLADKASPNWLRKFFIVLFFGRDNFVSFSKAVSSRVMADMRATDEETAHKLVRVARTHFFRRRQSMTGPNLMVRQQLFNGILGSESVKKAIKDEAENKSISQEQAKKRALKYIDEIAADYRDNVIRLSDRILSRLWHKIYNGINVKNAEKVRELAQNGHEIIYVPCHRSHMDYLLLTYVIYHQGLVTPHIAAGINLNFWPIGGIFRRAGAFFIRRTFAGNKLYTAVFREYLEQLFNKGYSVKFYAEGGRSRTGRLLPAKTGMLAMTIQAVMKGINRPVSLVPVYIGYEHVMEVKSYMGELRGKNKEKESFFSIFSAIRNLKNYGFGFLNFGEPILINHYLDQKTPNWRDDVATLDEKKPSWLTPTVNELGTQILENINEAAAISGMSLTAMCLLAAEKRAMTKEELLTTMQHFLDIQRHAPYSNLSSFPECGAEELLQNTMRLGKINQQEDSFGEIYSVERSNAIILTYYRNNILHLFAIPGLIANIVISLDGASKTKILDTIKELYPLLKKELFMSLSVKECVTYAETLVKEMSDLGLIRLVNKRYLPAESTDKAFYSLWILRSVVQETLQRYSLVLSILDQEDAISRAQLEKMSRQLAERMATLHGISAPEFYDKNVLATFVSALKENKIVGETDDGLLQQTERSSNLQGCILELISPEFGKRLSLVH